MSDRVVLLTIPQLRCRDVTPGGLGSLERLTSRGSMTSAVPPFPGLASSAFASLMTGLEPREHGLIGNVFLDRVAQNVVTVPLPDSAVLGRKLWHMAREERPDARVMLWFTPDTRGADVDLMAWVDRPRLLHTAPESLQERLETALGPFPNEDQSEEPTFEPASTWILQSAARMIREELPDLAVVRVPYLGQIARRYGPDGRHAGRAIRTFDAMLTGFLKALPDGTAVVAVTESIVTPVTETLYPNRVLRELGLLQTVALPSGGIGVDLAHSPAFALADHQLCHIYFNDPSVAGTVASTFSGAQSDGVALVVASDEQRNLLGLDHPRAGDVVLVACPDSWFAPSWWTSDDERPVVVTESSIPIGDSTLLNPDHVRGSLGAPPPSDLYIGVLICSEPGMITANEDRPCSSSEVVRLVLELLKRPTTPRSD
jgi:predicted AlkP superfamily pyrophosphatase or phosphodiesterase